jgi:hypothetical protein
MVMRIVEIVPEVVEQGLTHGAKYPATEVIDGLPKGCSLVDASITESGTLRLSFFEPGETAEQYQNILIQVTK